MPIDNTKERDAFEAEFGPVQSLLDAERWIVWLARAKLAEAETARRKAAEEVLDWFDDGTDSGHTWRCKAYHLDKGEPCECGFQKDYDAWQATIPKEADGATSLNETTE